MLINFLKDPDIWSYKEAKTALTDIMVLKQMNFIKIIKTEKRSRLLAVVKEQTSKLQENWTYYQLFHHLLSLILFISLFKVHFANDDQRVLEVTTADRVCDLEFGVDFDIHLQQHQKFVGRHWLFEGIHQRMEESSGVLLVADTGYGKSAAMANIIQGKHNLTQINLIHHLCISSEAKFQRADTFILNIVQNLYCKYPLYGKMLEKRGIFMSFRENEIKTSCKFNPVNCFDELIVEPLSMFLPPEGERLVLLIDALNECNTIGFGYSVITLLQLRYNKLPLWIKLLLTSKNDSKIIDNFRDLDHWHLYRESDNNKEDMLLYSKKNYIPRTYLEYLKWNFVLVKDMVEKINRNHALSVDSLPTSIDQFFGMEFPYVFEGCRSTAFKKAKVLFEIIIAGMKPLN
ncbi:uncharacterized protein LOC127705539 [Mytilus californianus]|uniref:uncharacterized protein LOC127705539 n=1 Tax=Mytilus californianus TaxID=6549 RepID=UPI00224570AD|nr:uncharacterized protein LOC127705539 [Mytilus californianus]